MSNTEERAKIIVDHSQKDKVSVTIECVHGHATAHFVIARDTEYTGPQIDMEEWVAKERPILSEKGSAVLGAVHRRLYPDDLSCVAHLPPPAEDEQAEFAMTSQDPETAYLVMRLQNDMLAMVHGNTGGDNLRLSMMCMHGEKSEIYFPFTYPGMENREPTSQDFLESVWVALNQLALSIRARVECPCFFLPPKDEFMTGASARDEQDAG
jgi:hypothetical protein